MTIDARATLARQPVSVAPSPADSGTTFKTDKRTDSLFQPFTTTPPFKVAVQPHGEEAAQASTEIMLVTALVDGTRVGSVLVSELVAGFPGVGTVGVARVRAGGTSSASDEQQQLILDGTGAIRLGWEGWSTLDLDLDGLTDAEVEEALNALPSMTEQGGEVSVSGFVVTFGGALAGTDVDTITIDAADATGTFSVAVLVEGSPGGDPVNELQRVTLTGTGTYLLSIDGGASWSAAIGDGDSLAAITSALEALSAPGDFALTGDSGEYVVEFQGALAGAPQALMVADSTDLATDGVDEVQTVTPLGDSGTFTLAAGGPSTAALALGASGATVQSALEGLLGAGNVSVTRNDDGVSYQVVFQGDLASQPVALLTGSGASLVINTHDWTVKREQDGSSAREIAVGDWVEAATLPDWNVVAVTLPAGDSDLDLGVLGGSANTILQLTATDNTSRLRKLHGGAPGRRVIITCVGGGFTPKLGFGFVDGFVYLNSAAITTDLPLSTEGFIEFQWAALSSGTYWYEVARGKMAAGVQAWGFARMANSVVVSERPAMDGVQATGTSVASAAADHVHPSDTSRQAHDTDLDDIAALTPTDNDVLQRKASHWTNRTPAQLKTDLAITEADISGLVADLAAKQPLDSDLTAIAALATTTFGRALLALADAAALRSTAGLVIGTDVEAHDADLTTIAGLATSDNDFLQRKSGAWTHRTPAQVIADLGALGTTFQPLDAELSALAALVSAADKLPYFTGAGTAALATLSAFIRTLLDDADAATARSTLGVVIGTDVEAHDADLTTIAGLTPTNDDVLQRKAGAWANRTIAQLLVDLAAPGTTFQPLDSDLTSLAGLGSAADKLAYTTAAHTWAEATLTSFIRTLLDDADAATARTTLGALATGSALLGVSVILTGTTSYTAPAGTQKLVAEGIGGGGGGSGCAASGTTAQCSLAGGGGGAGWSQKLLTANIGTHVVAVGAGGAGGAAGANNGLTGGDTTLADTATTVVLIAKAGQGSASRLVGGTAIANFTAGGFGATGTGDASMAGARGSGMRLDASHAESIGGEAARGGARSDLRVQVASGGADGSIGRTNGGGGTGGVDTNNTARAGGNGADGVLEVSAYG
jgi:hypothetical protein